MSLRGASAEALANLTAELSGSLSGKVDAGKVGQELFSVSSVLRSEPALRRVATDISLPATAKRDLVASIFKGKITAATQTVLASAVGYRWTATRDLADALEHLGVVAVVSSAGSDSARMSDELFAFGQIVDNHPELRDALSDPARSVADKAGLLSGLLDGKALPGTVALAEQALAGSYRTVKAALTEYQHIAAQVHEQKVATVRVARPLAEAEQQRLIGALAAKYHREIHLNVVLDPTVLGGIRVEIGDDVIDGTMSSRLDDAQRKLAG